MHARKTATGSTSVKKNHVRLEGSRSSEREDKLNVVAAVAVLPLMAWAELEEWQRDNLYINTGYRPISRSCTQSWKSWFYLHNETVNIYTHLIGALAVIPTWYYIQQVILARYPTTTSVDSAVLAINFIAAIACLTASTTYHTLMNHSHEVEVKWLLIDFIGILAMIIGSFYPGVYYGFYCEPTAMLSYWTMITTLGGASIVVFVVPEFRKPQWRTLRTVVFAGVALSGLVPIAHGIWLHGADRALHDMGAIWYLIEGLFYLTGAIVYALRFPEIMKPGAFDIWGHAHQIMHITVLIGAVCHLRAILIAMDYNHNPMTRRC